MQDLGDETNRGNRRRSRTTDGDSFALQRSTNISGSLMGSHHFNLAGDIISGNTLNNSGGIGAIGRRMKRSSLNPYALVGASFSDDSAPSSPEKMMSPQRGGSQRLRASTWDTAMKFSPLQPRKRKKAISFEKDDVPIIALPEVGEVDTKEGDDNELYIILDKRDFYKLPSKYEMEDMSYSSHSGEEEEEPEPAVASTPKANNLPTSIPASDVIKRFQEEYDLDKISNLNPAFVKKPSSQESSQMTLSTFGADSHNAEEEEAKVEEGEVVANEAKKLEPKQVSFAVGFDPLSHQISYHTDISFMEESFSTSERRKYVGSQTQEVQRRSSSSLMTFEKVINPCKCLSWSLVGSYIIRTAPCFWCMKTVGVSATDRQIVIRLNVLIVFFCLVQIASGLFSLSTVLMGYKHYAEDAVESREYYEFDTDKPIVTQDLWSLTTFVYFLGLINLILLIAAMLAQRAIRYVNLAKSVRYMWALFWILPLQMFFSIGLFDYSRVMEVWAKHWWDDKSLSWYRELFCDDGTAQGKCMVPILGGLKYIDEDEWCLAYFNATDCKDIREEAQYDFVVANYFYFALNGIWALILAVLMWVTLNVLQEIITLPIVQRSKESNIPLWLTFPIIGSYTIGYVLLFSETSIDEVLDDIRWIGITYMVSGGSFTLLALVGIVLKCYPVLNTKQKKVKQGMIVLFIVVIILTIFAVSVVFVVSLIYSLSIVDLPLTRYSEIACALDVDGSCTGCDSSYEELVCPEWTKDDVARVLQTMTKQSATIAAIFLVYALATLRYGFVLFRHVSRYQIEYV